MSESEANTQEVTALYANLSDDALLELVIEGGLTVQAQSALSAEMRRRSLGEKDVQTFQQWKEEYKLNQRPPTPQHTYFGYGIRYVGRKPLESGTQDSSEFITTRFLVLRGAAVVPLGSYCAVGKVGEYPHLKRRVDLQWDQVWLGMRGTLFAFLMGAMLAAISIYFTEHKHR